MLADAPGRGIVGLAGAVVLVRLVDLIGIALPLLFPTGRPAEPALAPGRLDHRRRSC